jgi:type VI secretion system secreted protein VgrG
MGISRTQKNRILSVSTPLGQDVLLLGSFSGAEGMSRLFSYQLSMISDKQDIAAKDIVGKSVTWRVLVKDTEPRFFNGFVSRFVGSGLTMRDMRSYRAQVVPWLWFLTRTANCQIFQKKSAPDIIKAVFDGLGFSDYQLELKNTHPKRDYCVQYRETAFNFVSRLMEEEGIFYFFRHEDGKHTLVLADQKTSYKDLPANPMDPGARIESFDHQFEYRPGKWTRTDYNFETPSTSLLTNTNTIVDLPNISKFEMFDYPGDYLVKGDGAAGTKLRMEEEEAGFDVATATSACATFTPGGKFSLIEPDVKSEEGKNYVVTYIEHTAVDVDFQGGDAPSEYSNVFQCIPSSVTFRPGQHTRKPLIAGAQTAVVVGPSGEEIYTDKYGRVKVQFFWDRLGKKDENSSCWIRVAENWAGKNWGIVFNPRIGQEVIVEFLEGDPDRPIITGRVYNAEQMPPYELPANQTQSTIKTRSSKGGGTDNFNELRFEDKKSSEEIYFHAEKDFNRVVENNDTLKVGSSKADDGSQTIEIYKDRTETVKTGNEKITIEKGDRTEEVKTGNESITIGQGNRTITVSQGNDTHKISQGNREVEISMGNDTLTIKMGNQTTQLSLGASSTEAMQSIELKVGQSSVKLDQMGVTIKGMMISIQGQIQTEVKGLMTTVSADAILQAKGALTMIG